MGHFILKQLHCIHALGYVHADIREINIVFSDNNKNAWIIDLDTAAKVGDRYPHDYNHQQITWIMGVHLDHGSALQCTWIMVVHFSALS